MAPTNELLRHLFSQSLTKVSEYTDQKIVPFSRDCLSLLNAHCFFDRASSKANSPSLLCFVHQRLKRPPKNFKPTLHSLGRFWLGTLACFYYREFKINNWRVHSSCHFHSSHFKPIQTTSVSCTRTSSNLVAKRKVIPFCKSELHT